jgi:hypothetical protein
VAPGDAVVIVTRTAPLKDPPTGVMTGTTSVGEHDVGEGTVTDPEGIHVEPSSEYE